MPSLAIKYPRQKSGTSFSFSLISYQFNYQMRQFPLLNIIQNYQLFSTPIVPLSLIGFIPISI